MNLHKGARKQLIRELSFTVVSASWATVDWYWPKEQNWCMWAIFTVLEKKEKEQKKHWWGMHIRLLLNCIFRNLGHQNPEHGMIFRNTTANVSTHAWNQSGQRFFRKITGQSYSVCLCYWIGASGGTVCKPTVHQLNDFTTVYSAGVTSLACDDKGHISWYSFLNVWKHLLFTGDGMAGVKLVNSATLCCSRDLFLQTVLWFWCSVWLAASWVWSSPWGTLEKQFLFHVFRIHTKNFPWQICIFASFAHMQCIQKWLQQIPVQKLWLLLAKIKKAMFVLV